MVWEINAAAVASLPMKTERSDCQRRGAQRVECEWDTSGDSSCSIIAPLVSTWITLGVGSSPVGIIEQSTGAPITFRRL